MKFIKCLLVCSIATSVCADKVLMDELTTKLSDETYKKMTSVVVSHNQQIIYEQYANQANQNTQHDMRSASKSLTSLAIGLAIKEGLLKGVDELVLPHFRDKFPLQNPDDRKSKITLQDLLTMSSPLECDDWNSASRGNEERMYIIEDWSRFILDLPIRGIPPWKKTPANSKYGRTFSYCTGGVQVLADLIGRVSKQPMSELLQDKLFSPLGIKPPEFSQSPLGQTNGGGGAKLTSRDWIKIGEMMLAEGQYKQQQILPSKWVSESFKPRAVIDEDRNIEYGYLWWIFTHEVNDKTLVSYAASGNGGNYAFITPELNAVTVITSMAYNTNYMHQQSQEIFTRYVVPHLLAAKAQ
ncbi:MAG: serine hydrolase [Marinicella sp.]